MSLSEAAAQQMEQTAVAARVKMRQAVTHHLPTSTFCSRPRDNSILTDLGNPLLTLGGVSGLQTWHLDPNALKPRSQALGAKLWNSAYRLRKPDWGLLCLTKKYPVAELASNNQHDPFYAQRKTGQWMLWSAECSLGLFQVTATAFSLEHDQQIKN